MHVTLPQTWSIYKSAGSDALVLEASHLLPCRGTELNYHLCLTNITKENTSILSVASKTKQGYNASCTLQSTHWGNQTTQQARGAHTALFKNLHNDSVFIPSSWFWASLFPSPIPFSENKVRLREYFSTLTKVVIFLTVLLCWHHG